MCENKQNHTKKEVEKYYVNGAKESEFCFCYELEFEEEELSPNLIEIIQDIIREIMNKYKGTDFLHRNCKWREFKRCT